MKPIACSCDCESFPRESGRLMYWTEPPGETSMLSKCQGINSAWTSIHVLLSPSTKQELTLPFTPTFPYYRNDNSKFFDWLKWYFSLKQPFIFLFSESFLNDCNKDLFHLLAAVENIGCNTRIQKFLSCNLAAGHVLLCLNSCKTEVKLLPILVLLKRKIMKLFVWTKILEVFW